MIASENHPDRQLLMGQKVAFAAASLAVGVCCFINLLGMEKAALAIVFGVLALKNGAGRVPIRRGFARFGIGLGVLQIVLVITALVLFWDDVMRFFEFVERFQTQPE